MAGHLFVLRGDLTRLHCSAILVPCDNNWEVVWDHWSALLDEECFEPSCWGRRLIGATDSGRFMDVAVNNGRKIRLVVTANGWGEPDWVADGVVAAIADFASDLSKVSGRVKPLLALPLVGTGAGGFEQKRGSVIQALLPALRRVAHSTNVDVALVLRDERDHAAIQRQRSADDWSEFSAEHLGIADKLGVRASQGELSLFLGSGVSTPLGLPDWEGLLSEIEGGPLSDYSTKKAPHIAQRLQDRFGRDVLCTHIATRLQVSGFAPAHLLLAGLGVRQVVTTNYDNAYENALDGILGTDTYRVLARQLAVQPDPWLLKLHGDVGNPESMTVTTDDYRRLKSDYGALHAIVESLLMTSHLMFVGFSMGDLDFVGALERVRKVRALAADAASPDFATVLALHPGAVSSHPGFSAVPMLEGSNNEEAARLMEIFLDRVSWSAATQHRRSHAYLLDPHYEDLFANDPATMKLREVLGALLQLPSGDPARRSSGWEHVEAMLMDLGGFA